MLREVSAVCRCAVIRPERAASSARLSDMTGYLTLRLTLQLGEFAEHFVGGLDDLRVGAVGALGLDHVGELLRDVDVGALQRVAGGLAGRADAGIPQIEGAAVAALVEGGAVAGRQAVGVLHDRDRNLVDRPAHAVVEDGGDDAVLADLDAADHAEEGAILVDLGRHVFAGELGDPAGIVDIADVEVEPLQAAVHRQRQRTAGDARYGRGRAGIGAGVVEGDDVVVDRGRAAAGLAVEDLQVPVVGDAVGR